MAARKLPRIEDPKFRRHLQTPRCRRGYRTTEYRSERYPRLACRLHEGPDQTFRQYFILGYEGKNDFDDLKEAIRVADRLPKARRKNGSNNSRNDVDDDHSDGSSKINLSQETGRSRDSPRRPRIVHRVRRSAIGDRSLQSRDVQPGATVHENSPRRSKRNRIRRS